MVQTLPAEDFSRTYSPNVVETFAQRIPGVTTNNVRATNSPRTYATAASQLRRCRARRKGSPSTCKVSASMKPSATPLTGI